MANCTVASGKFCSGVVIRRGVILSGISDTIATWLPRSCYSGSTLRTNIARSPLLNLQKNNSRFLRPAPPGSLSSFGKTPWPFGWSWPLASRLEKQPRNDKFSSPFIASGSNAWQLVIVTICCYIRTPIQFQSRALKIMRLTAFSNGAMEGDCLQFTCCITMGYIPSAKLSGRPRPRLILK